MRRRATTGVDGTREVGFCFFFGGCSGVGGGLFHMLRSDATRTNALFGFVGGAVVVCSEGGCGSMCWPVDRPATHAAAGAAARGALIFCFGGLFHMLRSGWHERVRGGGFNPLRGATTGVVMRRRATSGEMARGGLVFVFSLEVAPVSEGDSFTCSGVVRHACRHRVTARGVFVLGDCFTCSGATRRGLMRFLVLWGGRCCRLF